MEDIIAFIEGLIEKDYAYEVDGDVYYRTRKFENYGKLSHQSIDELRSGARIQVGEKKTILLILLYGKTRKMEKSLGKVLGEKEDQGGISNVQLWRKNI